MYHRCDFFCQPRRAPQCFACDDHNSNFQLVIRILVFIHLHILFTPQVLFVMIVTCFVLFVESYMLCSSTSFQRLMGCLPIFFSLQWKYVYSPLISLILCGKFLPSIPIILSSYPHSSWKLFFHQASHMSMFCMFLPEGFWSSKGLMSR